MFVFFVYFFLKKIKLLGELNYQQVFNQTCAWKEASERNYPEY